MRRIIQRIARSAPSDREPAPAQLMILAGLRRLEDVVEREAQRMPIYIDLMENRVLGP